MIFFINLPKINFIANVKDFDSDRAPMPVGAYPHAKRVGGFLFLSGVGPRKKEQKEIPGVSLDAEGNILDYDIEKQAHAVMENVRFSCRYYGISH